MSAFKGKADAFSCSPTCPLMTQSGHLLMLGWQLLSDFASVYLQCIGEHNAKRRECRARAEWFGEEARSELTAGWPLVALGPVLVVWPLMYLLAWTARRIRRVFQPRA